VPCISAQSITRFISPVTADRARTLLTKIAELWLILYILKSSDDDQMLMHQSHVKAYPKRLLSGGYFVNTFSLNGDVISSVVTSLVSRQTARARMTYSRTITLSGPSSSTRFGTGSTSASAIRSRSYRPFERRESYRFRCAGATAYFCSSE
jgi:hypothetical protein